MKLNNTYKKTFKRQHGQSDCGVACLLSIISFHGGSETLDHIRQLSGTTKRGTSMLGLQQAAGQLGLSASGLKADSIENLHELDQPAILHVIMEGYRQHYVVFYGFAGDNLVIGDPAKGVEIWTIDQLKMVWRDKILLSLKPSTHFKKSDQKNSQYEVIINWIKEDFNVLVAALFLGAVISIFNLSTAIFTQKLIDEVLPSREISVLVISLALFGVLLIFKSLLSYLRSNFLLTQSRDFNIRMVGFFFKSLIRLPKPFFDSKKSGEMIARMNDTRRIQSAVSNLIGNLILEILVLTISIVALLVYQWQVGLLVIVIAPLFTILHFKFQKPILKHQKATMSSYGLNESNYIDVINGISEVKTSSKQNLFEKSTMAFYRNFQENSFSLGKAQVNFGLIAELISIVLTLSVIGYTSSVYLQGSMALGTLIACFTLLGSITPSIIQITLFNIQIQEAKVAFERMNEFSGLAIEDLQKGDHYPLNAKCILVKNISFHYPGMLDLLKNVDLEIKKGEFRALLGESGEGKSTLIQLIQRFYQPQYGEIWLDMVPIETLNMGSYRERISVVPQDIKIFNHSLFFNVVLSEDPATYERFLKWSEKFGFDAYFKIFPQGYGTLLGEEGTNISGGQRQIVGLARALFRNPDFLLLDESTSAMDKKTESFIIDILNQFKRDIGIFMITHRVTTASKSDYIYLLENGCITMEGAPKEFLKSKNMFSDFYKEFHITSSALLTFN